MADINNVTLNATGSPTVSYRITYTKSRLSNTQMRYDFTLNCNLDPYSASIGTGYALLCTMTVNGASNQVRIKANDGDNWNGASSRTKYVSVTCSSSKANELQPVVFRVVSDGRLPMNAGAINNSSYTVTSSALLPSIPPTPPTSVIAAPATYSSENVAISWSGASAGSNPIKGYRVTRSTSSDGVSWDTGVVLSDITQAATHGSYTDTAPSRVPGIYTRYDIQTIDNKNLLSGVARSNVIRMNQPPYLPVIHAPQNGSYTYRQKPVVLIETLPEPNGQSQVIEVKAASGAWYNSVDHPQFFSTTGATPGGIRTTFTNPEVQTGAYSIEVRLSDGITYSEPVIRPFTILPSPFEQITANATHVKASHMLALRSTINNVRHYYGLPAYAWAQQIISGRTLIRDWPLHILELRAALQGVIDLLNNFDRFSVTFDIPQPGWLPIGTGKPRADVMNQVRNVILTL